MLFLFTFKSGSVLNRRPSPLPEYGLFSLSSFRGEDATPPCACEYRLLMATERGMQCLFKLRFCVHLLYTSVEVACIKGPQCPKDIYIHIHN